MTRARFPMLRCPQGGVYRAQCSAGADRGNSARIQWPVIPAVPCLSRYGIDATPCPVDHSIVLSRRPAEIAGVVDALIRRDMLSRRLVKAGATGC